MCTLKEKIAVYKHNCGSMTYMILKIYRKTRFACTGTGRMDISIKVL